jgi:predicted oxidoreductase
MRQIFLLGILILIISIVFIIYLIISVNRFKKERKNIEQYLTQGWEAIGKRDIYKAGQCYSEIRKIYNNKIDKKNNLRNRITLFYNKLSEMVFLLKSKSEEDNKK